MYRRRGEEGDKEKGNLQRQDVYKVFLILIDGAADRKYAPIAHCRLS